MTSPGPDDSPSYRDGYHGYTERPEDTERETSASGSASCEDEDDERDYDGKRSGDPLSGLAAKKRRKQSKPIRLGSDEEGLRARLLARPLRLRLRRRERSPDIAECRETAARS